MDEVVKVSRTTASATKQGSGRDGREESDLVPLSCQPANVCLLLLASTD